MSSPVVHVVTPRKKSETSDVPWLERVHLRVEDREILWAARHNDLKHLKMALAMGANVNACREDLRKPLHIASENGFVEFLQILVSQKGIRLNDRTLFGSTALGGATMLPKIDALKILLGAGANPNRTQTFSKTPLHNAVLHNKLEFAKLLLKYKANPNSVDCFDQTPLYISVIASPYPAMTKLLLKAGAHPNFRFKNQMPLLSVAILHAFNTKHLKAISYLIKYGAKINETDMKKETALHKAAFRGSAQLVQFLAKHRANIHAKNVFRKEPLDLAKLHRNHEAANELKLLAELEEEQEIMELFEDNK